MKLTRSFLKSSLVFITFGAMYSQILANGNISSFPSKVENFPSKVSNFPSLMESSIQNSKHIVLTSPLISKSQPGVKFYQFALPKSSASLSGGSLWTNTATDFFIDVSGHLSSTIHSKYTPPDDKNIVTSSNSKYDASNNET